MGGFSVRGRTPLVGMVGSIDGNTYRVITDNHTPPFFMVYTEEPSHLYYKRTTADLTELNLLLHTWKTRK